MTTLIIATRNQHKTNEIRDILGKKICYLTLNDFPAAPAVVEDGTTFEQNARKKATELGSWLARNPKDLTAKITDETKLFVLADDSGLEVDALDGHPGVYSARFAALGTDTIGNSPDAANNAKLLRMLETVEEAKRTARFRCVLALTQISFAPLSRKPFISTADGLVRYTRFFEGACEGKIGFAESGRGGFGYDPLFIPAGMNKTFAELGEKEKNKISHRARALEKLRVGLRS